MPPIRWTADTNGAVVESKDFKIVFNQVSGGIKSWRYKGHELIQSPLRPDFWRATTDNDRVAWRQVRQTRKLSGTAMRGKQGVKPGLLRREKEGLF